MTVGRRMQSHLLASWESGHPVRRLKLNQTSWPLAFLLWRRALSQALLAQVFFCLSDEGDLRICAPPSFDILLFCHKFLGLFLGLLVNNDDKLTVMKHAISVLDLFMITPPLSLPTQQ